MVNRVEAPPAPDRRFPCGYWFYRLEGLTAGAALDFAFRRLAVVVNTDIGLFYRQKPTRMSKGATILVVLAVLAGLTFVLLKTDTGTGGNNGVMVGVAVAVTTLALVLIRATRRRK